MFGGTYQGKKVLVTGHTGFKGSWLCEWLLQLGADVSGFSQPPPTEPALFDALALSTRLRDRRGEITDAPAVAEWIGQEQPDILFHLAAQPLVRASYQIPLATFATNVLGTVSVLEAVRLNRRPCAVVVVTTDKCYHNREWLHAYREEDRLGGHDPYSASKAAAEIVTASYRDAFFAAQGVAVATARAGNVIGGGDWAADRLLPDAVRAWSAGQTLHIRHPGATRPWQHVIEPLAAYLCLAEQLWVDPARAGAYNFGPLPHEAATVGNVVKMAAGAYPSSATSYENNSNGLHEAGWLALETAHARQALGVAPRWGLHTAVERTMAWYRAQQGGADARALCLADLDAWEAAQ